MVQKAGSFTFVLHSHLPFVISHGTWPHGTSWLNEAASETYMPLLNILNELVAEGRQPRLTIGITPVLCEMLAHDAFKTEFVEYVQMKIDAAIHDQVDFQERGLDSRLKLARMWEQWYSQVKSDFTEKYNKNLLAAFKNLQDNGYIDIITCGATHGYFPLLLDDRSIMGQVRVGVKTYQNHFGKKPRGIWLPECAYRPSYKWKAPIGDYPEINRRGIEHFLAENDIQYFFVDTHLLTGGETAGVYAARFSLLKQLYEQFKDQYKPLDVDHPRSPYEVYIAGSSETKKPVCFFTRDEKSGIVVWSGEHGYPGDGNYLDFHKKHFPGGHRYWKVTGNKVDLGSKQEYNPANIEPRLEENANHFKDLVKGILIQHKNATGTPGIITSMYDTELFGHWWFEGPRWIQKVLRWMEDDPEIDLVSAGGYLDANPPEIVVNLPEGSWGQGGYHWVWLNDWTSWTWEKIYACETRFHDLVEKTSAKPVSDDVSRLMKQLARELLLLQSSDWQFLITTWSARDYAELRIAEHIEKFNQLHDIIIKFLDTRSLDSSDWKFVSSLEESDSLFQDIEPRDFLA